MRRQNVFGFTAVTVLAFLVGNGIATAQTHTSTPTPDATTGLSRQVNLSPREQLAQSEGIVSRMDAARGGIRRMLETARAQRDVVKTLCLNDKLNQIDVAVRSARERRQSLEAAAQRSDSDLASHEYTILSVLGQRSDQLTAEAGQCIGVEASSIDGDGNMKTTIDPTIPNDSYMYPTITTFIEPPTCSSCFK